MASSTTPKKAPFKGSKGNVYKIPLHEYPDLVQVVEGFNQRVDYGDMEWLVSSMTTDGMKVPAQGYNKNNVWFITDGHRRLKAAKQIVKNGGEIIFTIQAEPKGYTDQNRYIDMITRNSGLPFSMIEEGRVYSKLVGFGYTDKMVAEKVNKSVVHVRNAMSLLEMPDDLQANIESGKVSASLVVEMAKKNDGETIAKNVDEALRKTKKKRVTGKDIAGAPSGRSRKTTGKKTVDGDDLTKVKGVGDKVATMLKENGIDTFKKMAKVSVEKYKELLVANNMSKFRNPAKWASLAHKLAFPKGDVPFKEPKAVKTPENKPNKPVPPQLPALLDMADLLSKLEKAALNAGGANKLKNRVILETLRKFAVGDAGWNDVEKLFITK